MSKLIEAFEAKHNLLVGNGTSDDVIDEAENQLGVTFSDEYKEYLKKYSIAAYGGHELTGISKTSRLNVVDVTRVERERNKDIPDNLYVIEQTNVEDIVIWQSNEGTIYYSSPNKPITVLFESLEEYISK